MKLKLLLGVFAALSTGGFYWLSGDSPQIGDSDQPIDNTHLSVDTHQVHLLQEHLQTLVWKYLEENSDYLPIDLERSGPTPAQILTVSANDEYLVQSFLDDILLMYKESSSYPTHRLMEHFIHRDSVRPFILYEQLPRSSNDVQLVNDGEFTTEAFYRVAYSPLIWKEQHVGLILELTTPQHTSRKIIHLAYDQQATTWQTRADITLSSEQIEPPVM